MFCLNKCEKMFAGVLCRKLRIIDEYFASFLHNFCSILVKSKNRRAKMTNLPRYTLRIPDYLHKKIKYTSSYNGRSKNKEIEIAIKRYINDFERLHGNIDVGEDIED